MTYVRWFAIAFAVIAVAVNPDFPNAGVRWQAWTLVAILAAGSFAIWGWSGRTISEDKHELIGKVAFAFDAAIVMCFVWVYAFERPYVTWALLLLLPLEGSLRYRMRGAVASVVAVMIFFLGQTFHRADVLGEAFDISTYIFVAGVTGLIAGVTGTMAEQWHLQSAAFEAQTIKLAEVDKLKDRFLAITSHEIRGPLTAIIAGVDTVRTKRDRLTPEQHDRLLEMVSLQGHQLARIVDDLQVTSQIQSGQLALQVDWADLEKTVHQALEAAASKRRQHQLETFIEPIECEIDGPRVGQIVRNLVENAYKYTPDRTRVSLTAKATKAGLSITVEDAGPGIPPDKRDQLFQAFSRIEETAAGQEGVGLGLYVVSQLIAAMDGRIDLSSSSRGTMFHIEVPCVSRRVGEPELEVIEGEGRGGEASG